MKGLGLNFKEKNTVIQSDVPGGPHIFPKWPYFSIFVIEKIVKNELFWDIQQLFSTKSISQNPMVLSDFWYLELGTFVILNMLAPILIVFINPYDTGAMLDTVVKSTGSYKTCLLTIFWWLEIGTIFAKTVRFAVEITHISAIIALIGVIAFSRSEHMGSWNQRWGRNNIWTDFGHCWCFCFCEENG